MKIGVKNLILAFVFAAVVVIAGLWVMFEMHMREVASEPVETTTEEGTGDAIPRVVLPETSNPAIKVDLFNFSYSPGKSSALDEVFEKFYAPHIAMLPPAENPEEPQYDIMMAEAELNQDDTREVLAMFFSKNSCGAKGCAFSVFRKNGDEWVRLNEWFNIPADGVYILPFATEGVSDIAFGPGELGYGIWRYFSPEGNYQYAGVSPTIPL